ncbi:hypothetical protein [Epibacterium ulvae]|uniref:hypothetical protein n=1 Tax=Epibacterium ulvae TaxID=1156985 RepID=UPI002493857D|nr:hypothetical protein [Epibacterium ulvae]
MKQPQKLTLKYFHDLQKTPEFQEKLRAFKESIRYENSSPEKQAEMDAFLESATGRHRKR